MITVPEATEKIVNRSRYLNEAISKKIVNNSSLARYIKEEVEELTHKDVSLPAIIVALNRLSKKMKPNYVSKTIFKTSPQITVQSNLSRTSNNTKQIIEEFADGGVRLSGLSSVTVELPKEAAKTPGIIYFFLKSLAWEGINIIKINSSFKNVTLIFEEKDTNRAFRVIQSLFTEVI